MIHVEPLTFRWAEWRERSKDLTARMQARLRENDPISAAREAGVWQKDLDAWLQEADHRRRCSVAELCQAELDMLFDTIDPGKGPKPQLYGPQRDDFRERWFEVVPLALTLIRLGFPKTTLIDSTMKQLSDLAHTKRWLP